MLKNIKKQQTPHFHSSTTARKFKTKSSDFITIWGL